MDTENKRRSAVGLYGLRTVPPIPGTTDSSTKRRHVSSFYAMEPQAGRPTFWVPVKLTSSDGWKQDGDTTQSWVDDGSTAGSWTPVLKVDE